MNQHEYIYILVICYELTHDYSAYKFDTYEDAINALNEYVDKEIKLVDKEFGYKIHKIIYSKDDIEIVYKENPTYDENYNKDNRTSYRVYAVPCTQVETKETNNNEKDIKQD